MSAKAPLESRRRLNRVAKNLKRDLRAVVDEAHRERHKVAAHAAANRLGVVYANMGRYPDALVMFTVALRLKPDLAVAYYNLGQCYVSMGQKDKALEAYQKLQTLDKKMAKELYDYINQSSGAVTRPSASAAPSTKPPQPGAPAAKTAEGHYAQGQNLYEAKDYPRALEAYKKAVALKPSWAQAQFGLGMTYIALEKRKEAMEVGDKLEKLDQKLYEDLVTESMFIDPVFLVVIGDKALNEKEPERALARFRDAVRLDPTYAKAREGLGRTYFILRQYPDAEAALKEAVRLKPDFAEAHFGLGMTYLAMGNKNAALQVYNTLQRIDKVRAQKLYNSINK